MSIPVPIIDDEIDEETEMFVGYIRLVNAVDPDNVIFGIHVSQMIINDNDGKCTCVYMQVCVCVCVCVCICICMTFNDN